MNPWLFILIVFVDPFLGGLGSVYLKKGSRKFNFNPIDALRNTKLLIGVSLFVTAAVIYIILLRFFDLSYLYPFTSLSYVYAAFLSTKLLRERMNYLKWGGIIFILIGVVLIAR